ncbi:MAG: hypothetical protein RID91_23105 [Azospirillaceae bacterium]
MRDDTMTSDGTTMRRRRDETARRAWRVPASRGRDGRAGPPALPLPRRLAACTRGATTLEYALIAALLAVVCAAALGNLGDTVGGLLQDTAVAFERAMR